MVSQQTVQWLHPKEAQASAGFALKETELFATGGPASLCNDHRLEHVTGCSDRQADGQAQGICAGCHQGPCTVLPHEGEHTASAMSAVLFLACCG